MKKVHIITANIFFFNFKNCRNTLTFLKSIALEEGGVILYKEVYYQFIKLRSKIPIRSIIINYETTWLLTMPRIS